MNTPITVDLNADLWEGLQIISRPTDTDVGIKSTSSFHLSVTALAPNYSSVGVVLYANNSKSTPYHPELSNNAWEHLKPQWRFTYLDGIKIGELAEVSYHTELIDTDDNVVGAIGDLKFFYIDDLPTDYGIPVMLQATIDGDLYSDATEQTLDANYNSKMSVVMPFYIFPLAPIFLTFTQNGALDIARLQWAGVSIPAYATIRGIPDSNRLPYPDDTGNFLNYPILFSYPVASSETYLNYTITPLSADYSSIVLNNYDMENGVVAGGWGRVEITPLEMCPNAHIVGNISLDYNPTEISKLRHQTAAMWVSNPEVQSLNKISTMFINASAESLNKFISDKSGDIVSSMLNESVQISATDISLITVHPDQYVWTSDATTSIHRRLLDGTITGTIPITLGTTIASTSLDIYGNVYCSLSNSPSALLINGSSLYSVSFSPTADTAPSGVKIVNDKHGGFFMAHTDATSSTIINVDSIYVQSSALELLSGQVVDVAIRKIGNNYQDYVVFSQDGTDSGIYQSIYNYTTKGFGNNNPMVSCDAPKNIAVDYDGNVWFSYDKNKIGKLSLGAFAEFQELSSVSAAELSFGAAPSAVDIIGGLCIDDMNYVNVLDSYANVIYRWYSGLPIDSIQNAMVSTKIYPATSGTAPSLTAAGDWTGQTYKYIYGTNTASTGDVISVDILGSSVPFEVRSISNTYGVRKKNGSWDMKEQIKSYVLPDYQKEFTSLWDDLIGTIVGDSGAPHQTFGRQFYEKIANFVANHSDIYNETVDAAYSNSYSIASIYNNYDIVYPATIKHWIDLLSIPFEKLRGEQYCCNRNFVSKEREALDACSVCGQIHPSNRGNALDISEYQMEIGTPIVLQDTFMNINAYDVFYPPISGSPSQLEEYGFRAPFVDEYSIFEYVASPTAIYNTQAEGTINWMDEYNDFDIQTTSPMEWFDDGGRVEQIFSEALIKNVALTPITYRTDITINPSETGTVIYQFVITDVIDPEFRLSFDRMTPIRESEFAPVFEWVIPIYIPMNPEDAAGITFTGSINNSLVAIESTISTDTYLEITIYTGVYTEDVKYYIPMYTFDSGESILIPILGDGSVYLNGSVFIDYTIVEKTMRMQSAGYLGFNYGDTKGFFPIYSEAGVI